MIIISANQWLEQSFTVGLSGLLTGVDVQIARNATPPAQGIALSIVPTVSGTPDLSTVLASALIAPSSVTPAFTLVFVDLSSAPLAVTAGQVLAISLTTTAPSTGGGINPYAWATDVVGGYAGGQGFVYHPGAPDTPPSQLGSDLGFRTYVDSQPVPEPASLLLLGTGALGLLGARRRRTRSDGLMSFLGRTHATRSPQRTRGHRGRCLAK